MSDGVVRHAYISECGLFRYSLRRTWDPRRPTGVFCWLNPSKADAEIDDPTVRKGMGFGKRWGWGGLIAVNMGAYRATKPRELRTVDDPFGPENAAILSTVFQGDHPIVVGWGGSIPKAKEWDAVAFTIRNRARRERGRWFCLGRTKYGEPRHPLMLAYSTPLEPWP